MTKTRTVYVVYAVMKGIKNYVSSYITRDHDNKFQPSYHNELSIAKPFESSEAAEKFIARINNVHHREFMVEPVEVPERAFSDN